MENLDYDYYCKKCGKVTKHYLLQMNRRKGVKLICLDCRNKTKWVNFKFLENKQNEK